jgi:hypothetical protein
MAFFGHSLHGCAKPLLAAGAPETRGVNLKKGKNAMEHPAAGMNWVKRLVFATRREKSRTTGGRVSGLRAVGPERCRRAVSGRIRTRRPFEPAKKEISTN